MSNQKTNVIFMNYQKDGEKQTKIKIGTWSDKQKQDFLDFINEHETEYYNGHCCFSVHFDKQVIHSRTFDNPKVYVPHQAKNKKNELIIEVIPDINHNECWANNDSACPICLQNGGCKSLFISQYIGKVLFPDKYTKQK